MCRRLLIVDDNVAASEMIVRALGSEVQVVTVQTQPQALEALERQDFAVALVDLRLEDSDTGGLTLLRQIRSKHPEVVRVLYSGSSVGPILLHALNSGDAWRFVDKPTELPGLRTVIREAMAHYKSQSLAMAIERLRTESRDRGEALNGRLDRTDERLARVAKNVELLSGQVKAHGGAIATVVRRVDDVEGQHGGHGEDVSAAVRAHSESLDEHAEQLGAVMAANARAREDQVRTDAAVAQVFARLDAIQGHGPKGSTPPTIATTEAKVDRMKAAMAVGGGLIGAGEIVAEVVKHLLK